MEVFVTGGTGSIGSRLIPLLLRRGHSAKALVRKASEAVSGYSGFKIGTMSV
jgi:uncharacterized protein YbjT (DUF2867 family)